MRYQSAGIVTPADVGKRVTIRRRLPDGHLGDVVGVLERFDPEGMAVRTRAGVLVEFAAEDVTAARVIPPAPPRPR